MYLRVCLQLHKIYVHVCVYVYAYVDVHGFCMYSYSENQALKQCPKADGHPGAFPFLGGCSGVLYLIYHNMSK